MQQESSLHKGFLSQPLESTLDIHDTEGDIPKWISGTFVSIGPAQFDIGEKHFKHWFDGFSMLKNFNFMEGKVTFQNRFLQSHQYIKSKSTNRLYENAFGTYADDSLFGKIKYSLKSIRKVTLNDDCNVNTTCISDHLIAMTETTATIEFNLKTAETLGEFQWKDNIPGPLQLAHPQLDSTTGEIINVITEIGLSTDYHIYKILPHTLKRIILQTYSSKVPFYMHSFSITENYVILFKSPLVLNKFKLFLGLPFNHALSYQKKSSSFFIIIDRRNGAIREIESDPFVCLHSANAYEKGNELILDLICYDDQSNPYDMFYLLNLRSLKPHFLSSELRRYVVNITSRTARFDVLTPGYHSEFPRVSSIKNGLDYHFVYTCLMETPGQNFYNALQKVNVQTGKIDLWKKDGYYFGEALFIKNPGDQKEDGGALFSISFNTLTQKSSLLILNACTMEQQAEIFLPFHIPFGLHGNFYPMKSGSPYAHFKQ